MKKIKVLLVVCVIVASGITSFNLVKGKNNLSISLADIAVMARADEEEPTIICNQVEGRCWYCDTEIKWVDGYGWSECNIGCVWSGYQTDICYESGSCYPGGCMTL